MDPGQSGAATTAADQPNTAGPSTSSASQPGPGPAAHDLASASEANSVNVDDQVQIEAEDVTGEVDEADSALGDDSQSVTTSLKSSITKYVIENGRRYHALKDGSYFLPNDEDELDRLDMFHHLLTLRCNDKLHLAPIDPYPQRILDLGTGTGIWCIEMGDLYPSAEVLGNDLSPVQPSLVPPNVKFEVDDIEADWIFTSPFDYIHMRYMAGSLRDWPRLVAQCYQHLKPGGWLELQDFTMKFYTTHHGAAVDGGSSFSPGCPLDRWTDEIIAGIKKVGLEPEPGPKLEGWVKNAGFVNVRHEILPIPVGTWPRDRRLKEVGAFDLVQFLEGLEAISLRVLTGVQGWSAEELSVFLALVRKDLNHPRLRAQHDFHVVYGQKPYEPDSSVASIGTQN